MSQPSVAAQAVSSERIRLAEVFAALSHALDMTEGQPAGHCVRVCWIGMHVGRRIGMSVERLDELYYTLLLKDLGCSSNAARICELYLTDDLAFKRDFKRVDSSLTQVLRFVLTHTGLNAGMSDRVRAVLRILREGGEIAQELIETRCDRGADIARQLRFPESVALGVRQLDEHWDGTGRPDGARGEAISLYARIALLAQVVDVFHTSGGRDAAVREIRSRSGTWFDPLLVDAFMDASRSAALWAGLAAPDLERLVFDLEPGRREVGLDDDYLDDVAAAFGQVVDAKSPYTAGHSRRVAVYADLVAERLGVAADRRRWLHRAALLHDVGKLGVSNAVLDKPGRLEPPEWAAVQAHATHTAAILSRISAFGELAIVSAAHHERLDGGGYPWGLREDQISLETRIITAADFFDALTADRPYRRAMPLDQAFQVIGAVVGQAVDPVVFEALRDAVALRPDLFDGDDRAA